MKYGTTRTTALSAALLLACSMTLLAAGGKERLPIGAFTARRLATPPKIDGVVSPGEWDKALTSSGMITPFDHTLMEAETTLSFAFDDRMFYFLFECTRGDREWKMWKSVRENDGYSFGDPSIEVWVTPPTLVPETYQSVINTYPAVLDMKMIPTRGYTAQGWKGNWELGVTEDDTSYVIEAALPVGDIDGFDSVKDGDLWRFLLCRTSPGTKSRAQASWSVTQGFAELNQHPQIRLTDDAPVIQLRNVTSVFTGKYDLRVDVVAPDATATDVTLELRVHKEIQHADDDRLQQETVSLGAGERKEVTLTGDVTDLQKGNLTLTATAKGGAVIFRQSFPFEVNGWTPKTPVRPENAREARELDLMVKYGPEHNVVMLRADIIDLPTREKATGGTVRLLDTGDGKELMSVPLPEFKEWYASTDFSLSKLKVPVMDYKKVAATEERNRSKEKENKKRAQRGQSPLALDPIPMPDAMKVTVEVSVSDAEGNVLRTESQELSLLRHNFVWANNDIGITDEAIPPWTPVTYDGETVGVWNRGMRVNGLGLLEGIDNGGTDQVRAMRLVAVVDGKETEIPAGPAELQKQVDAYVDLAGTGNAAGLALSASTRIEFDGFVLSRLTIAPQGDAPARVDKLYLEIVLPESEATHYCTTAGGWTAAHAKTPAYWSSQQTASGMLIGDFVPYIWLSNSDRAFCWLADSDKGWITDDDKSLPTQELRRENDTVTLRVHFIEVPTELTQATTVEYGYQAYPAKPLPPGWRAIICNQGKATLPGAPNTYFWFEGDWAVLWPYYCSPFPWDLDKSKAMYDRYPPFSDHRPMVGSIAHSIGRYRDYDGHQFDDYAVDWGSRPGDLSNANVASGKGPNDFRLYHYRMWVREAGFRGLYVDENYLSLDKNILSGGAYVRPDGRLQPGYSYIGLRDYFKRLKIMFHMNNVPAPNLWQHISSGAAYYAWFGDIFFEGENVEPTDLAFDYIEVLPAERMRAIGSAKCAGGAMTMMCQSQRHATVYEAKHTHQFLGWVMAHDILPEQVREYEVIAQEAGLYEKDVDFIGYWKADTPFSTTADGCVASAHVVTRPTGSRRALVWIVNTSREDASVSVDIDWKRLGLDATRTVAVNAETGELIALGGAGFGVRVLQRDFVAVHLIERQRLEGSESLRASFDNGRDADEAYGSVMFVPAGGLKVGEQVALVAGAEGKALAVGAGVSLWPHLHVTDAEGRVSFKAKLNTDAKGPVFTTSDPGARYPSREPVQTIRIAVEKQTLVFGWTPASGNGHEDRQSRGELPGGGWHAFDLAWKDGNATLKVDGKAVGSVPIEGMNICQGTGKALLESGAFTFGGRGGAVEAIDDVRCYRTAE